MGIFIIKSKHKEWFKVGHFTITERRPNVYYSFINKGLRSCIAPDELVGKLEFEDLELIRCYKNLNENDKLGILSLLKMNYNHEGNWFKMQDLETVINIVENEFGGILEMPNEEELIKAKSWAKKFEKK